MGLWGGEQYSVDRSKDLWNGSASRDVATPIKNAVSRNINEKIDPYFQNLQNFGANAKGQADDLSQRWDAAGAQGAAGSDQIYQNELGAENRQNDRWQGQTDAIKQETQGQRGRWDENLNQLGTIQTKQNQTWADFLGQTDKAVGDVKSNFDVPRSAYESQVADPSKRGFDPTTLEGMYARGAEQAQAGQQNSARQISKLSASTGVGGTGAQFRNLQQAQEAAQQAQMANARDVGIAQGTAQRDDLTKALAGLTDIGSAENAGTAQALNVGSTARQNMTEGERANMGLQQTAITGGNRDVSNLMSLGVDTEKARASDLAGIQKMQSDAMQYKADNTFKGLTGAGSAMEIGNNAALSAFGHQDDAINSLNDYLKTQISAESAQTDVGKLMLDSLGVPLQADQQDRGNPGFWAQMGNSLSQVPGKIITSWGSRKP